MLPTDPDAWNGEPTHAPSIASTDDSSEATPDEPTCPNKSVPPDLTEPAPEPTPDLPYDYDHPDPTSKPPGVFRLWLQNVMGFGSDAPFTKMADATQRAEEYQADISAWPETNLAWHKPYLSGALRSATKRTLGKGALSFTSSNRRSRKSKNYLPGGTAMILAATLASYHSQNADSDPGGRWCCVRLTGADSNSLAVYTVYRPCPGGNGNNTALPIN